MSLKSSEFLYPLRSKDGRLERAEPTDTGERGAETYLHVLLHGLMATRLVENEKRIELHIPDVPSHGKIPGHLYRAGTFGNLYKLPPGDDYKLTGVDVGSFAPDWKQLAHNFLVLSEPEGRVTLQPAGTHAKLSLPWPHSVDGVRQLVDYLSPMPLFLPDHGFSVDPRQLLYIPVLTYKVTKDTQPTLYRGDSSFWHSEARETHNRLHIYADPPTAQLKAKEHHDHMSHAYAALGRQLFDDEYRIQPNMKDDCLRASFLEPRDTEEIPHWEQGDLVHERMHTKALGCIGNCLSVMLRA